MAELRSGMTIGIGGWGSRRKPMALVRAILRSEPDRPDDRLLRRPRRRPAVAAGRVRRLVTGFVSLDSIPLEPHFQAARQTPPSRPPSTTKACSSGPSTPPRTGLPFLPTRAGLGSDVLRVNPELRTVRSPYPDDTARNCWPSPRSALDAALIHLNRADAAGTAQFLGPDLYFDDLFAAAAARTLRLLRARSCRPARCSRWWFLFAADQPLADSWGRHSPNGAHFTVLRPRLRPRTRRSRPAYVAAAARPAGVGGVRGPLPVRRRGRATTAVQQFHDEKAAAR